MSDAPSPARANRSPRRPGPAERVLALAGRNPRRALDFARRALAGGAAREPVARARLVRALGHALRAVGEYREARGAYLEARRAFRRLGLELDHAICALGLVDACMYLGRPREALRVAEEARRVFLRRRDRSRLAKLEANVGNLYHHTEQLDDALSHYDRATRLFADVGTPVERASVDHNRANILTHLGRRRDAERLYLRAHRTFVDADQPVLAAQTRYGLACLRFLVGDYAAAILELETVRPDLARLGSRPLLALADLDLAEVLVAMRLYPEGLTLARAAASWFRKHGAPLDRAKSELFCGIALAGLGRRAEAAQALLAAERLFATMRHEPARALTLLARAQLEMLGDRTAAAARLALDARRKFARSGFPARAIAAGATAAESLLASGRDARARDLSRGVLREPRCPGDAYSRARLHRVEGAAAARMGQRETALGCYRRALDEASQAHRSLFVDEWRVGFLEGQPQIAEEALGLLLARRPAPRPDAVWRWLSRAHQDGPPNHRGPTPSTPTVARQIAGLRAELEACYARLWHVQGDHSRRAGAGAVQGLERRARSLEGRLRRLAGFGRSTRHRPRKATMPRAPARNQVHLTYFVADGRIGALRRDPDGWTLVPDLISVGEVEQRLRLFHYQMSVRTGGPGFLGRLEVVTERARAHLRWLGATLLDPVLDSATAPSLLRISPYGPLFRVPFHALPWRGSALVEGLEVAIDPDPFAATPPPRRRGRAWVLGLGEGDQDAIEDEARAVASVLRQGGVAVELRVGAATTRDALASAAADAALIHFCGHAVYRAAHPEFSSLRLADGWASARDLAELPLGGATVVVSACETGPRGVVAGAEMLGLVRGLAYAGAATIVASLWRVDDRATREIMIDLYCRWRTHGNLGGALRETQGVRARRGDDPYLWAPFCLIGDSRARWPVVGGRTDADPAGLRSSLTAIQEVRHARA